LNGLFDWKIRNQKYPLYLLFFNLLTILSNPLKKTPYVLKSLRNLSLSSMGIKNLGENFMLRSAIMFFILAIIAAVLGLGNIAGLSMEIARILIAVFIILAIISGLVHIFRGKNGD
jgi:uncharacterized membrane protein YtjA (UPF0391 family)